MHLAKNLLQSRVIPLLFLSDRHWLVLKYPEIEVMWLSTSENLYLSLDKLQSLLKHALRHNKPTTTQFRLSLNYYENGKREACCTYYSSYLKHTVLYENNTKHGHKFTRRNQHHWTMQGITVIFHITDIFHLSLYITVCAFWTQIHDTRNSVLFFAISSMVLLNGQKSLTWTENVKRKKLKIWGYRAPSNINI